MILLSSTNTLGAVALTASKVTSTVFGMKLDTGVESYSVLDQRQLATTAATIYTAPSGCTCFIKSISVVNNDTDFTTFQYFVGGTTQSKAITPNFYLPAGGAAYYEDGLGWQFYGPDGYLMSTPYADVEATPNYGISGSIAETIMRPLCLETATSSLTSGQLYLMMIWLVEGQTVSSISFFSAGAAGTPVNQLFGLYDIGLNLLATSADNTTTAWAATTIKTLNMTTPYVVKRTGQYYLGIMVKATTVPTLKGRSRGGAASLLTALEPKLCGNSTTGLTTALPNPAGAITAGGYMPWGCVS